MALGYLLGAAFQNEDQNGKPRTGGTIRVCKHGTTTPYITYRDFDGNRNPADVPLNDEGMAVIIADDANAYDVYCKDALGVERWSRLNVTVGGSGGGGGGGEYVAGDGIDITGSTISVDTTVIQPILTAGDNITISDNTISATDTTYSAGAGIGISNNAISRKVQFVSTSHSYSYVRSIIDAGDLPVLDKVNGSMHDYFVCTMFRGSDIQFVGSAYGQTTLYTLASNNTWTSQILEPQILQSNAGRILAVNAAGTDAEWRSWVAVPSYAFADRGKLLKVVYDGSSTTLAWGQPDGYVPWVTDWASGYTHSHTVTADEVTAGYFDMYQSFAAGADTASSTTNPIRVNLVWDTQCSSGLASNYVSSIDFAIGVDGGSYRTMFTDNAPAHEVHKDWYLYPNYLLHTRCNSIRIRYHLTSNATAGTEFQNEVSGLVDQVR